MIKTKEQLKKCLEKEKNIYTPKTFKGKIEFLITSDFRPKVYKLIKSLRKQEYHHNNSGTVHKICYMYFRRKSNLLGQKLGIEVWDNTFDEGLTIYHPGNIVVNGNCKIGKNLKLHGSNCIGNSGLDLAAPTIGDNVRLGAGAIVIGDVFIADDVTIAAGAVVVKSCYEKGALLAGVPASIVRHGRTDSLH